MKYKLTLDFSESVDDAVKAMKRGGALTLLPAREGFTYTVISCDYEKYVMEVEVTVEEKQETSSVDREEGFYWVKSMELGWIVGEWYARGKFWYALGLNEWDYKDSDFVAIGPRIYPPDHKEGK